MGKVKDRGTSSNKKNNGASEKKEKPKKVKLRNKGWEANEDNLESELACIGLRVKQITGDGKTMHCSCFFRAICDQVDGNESQHAKLRQQVIEHIQNNQEDFAPFVEDDEPFEKYVKRMKKDGCWAGYLEMVAVSNLLQANIHVHQSGSPRWVVGSFTEKSVRNLHISYHDGQHYNSVRNHGDMSSSTAPEPIMMTPVSCSIPEEKAKENASSSWGSTELKQVMKNSGCNDRGLISKILDDVNGDVDDAVERIIEHLSNLQEGEAQSCDTQGPSEHSLIETKMQETEANGMSEGGNVSLDGEGQTSSHVTQSADSQPSPTIFQESNQDNLLIPIEPSSSLKSGEIQSMLDENNLSPPSSKRKEKSGSKGTRIDKKPSRNKECNCGSRKKYKNCCGVAVAASARRQQAESAASEQTQIAVSKTTISAAAKHLETLQI